MSIEIRPAAPADWATIVEFNCRLAAETEGKILDPAIVGAGVQRLLAMPHRGRYLLASIDGQPAGQLMHTHEWSDWRNGDLWWLQSVYVHEEFRGRGVLRALFQQLRDEARADPEVVGLRLYVERENERAKAAYLRLGMQPAGYEVIELLFSGTHPS